MTDYAPPDPPPVSTSKAPLLRLKKLRQSRAVDLGHPWVYASEAGQLPSGEPLWATAWDSRRHLLGSGVLNPHSQILWRRYSRSEEAFGADFLRRAIGRAVDRRGPEPACRLIWADADDLPGLVVDRYGEVLAVQLLTRAMEAFRETIEDALRDRLAPVEIVWRNDAAARGKEGLDTGIATASGHPLEPFPLEIGGLRYQIDLLAGQKTGFYLDQREQQQRVGALAEGRRVLDAFCNQGAFGLQCARHGAAEVLGLDQSEESLRVAAVNAEANGLSGRVRFEALNVFDWFTGNRDEAFDLIVLDPPPFARNRKALEGALRGYKELNLRALRLLRPGGILATYSCSQVVAPPLFEQVVREAAADAGRSCRIREQARQPADHPVRLDFPESEYLKGLLLEVE